MLCVCMKLLLNFVWLGFAGYLLCHQTQYYLVSWVLDHVDTWHNMYMYMYMCIYHQTCQEFTFNQVRDLLIIMYICMMCY